MTAAKPASRPNVPHFSSGPCAKRPGWNAQNLKDAALGRSHRAKVGKAKLKLAIELTREVLEVPAGYKIGIVPASDTGAVEMALWSLLGARPVTTIAWESFGEGWVSDIVKELKLKDVTKLHAGYGEIPDLSQADPASDIVFTWNGTTSGVRVPNADWISADRERRCQHQGARRLEGEDAVDRFPGQGSGDPFQYLGVHESGRSRDYVVELGRAVRLCQEAGGLGGEGRRRLRFRALSRRAGGVTHLVRRHGGSKGRRGFDAVDRLGVRRNQIHARQGGVSSSIPLSSWPGLTRPSIETDRPSGQARGVTTSNS